MLKKIVFYSFLGATTLFSQTFKGEGEVEIIAENISSEGKIVNATGDVVVYSLNYYITANKIAYDKNSGTMELFGDVSVIRDNESISFSDYLFIDTKKDFKKGTPLVLIDDKNKLWTTTKESRSDKNVNYFDSTILSSCDCIDPAWNIGFTSGDYDSDEKWINTYNTTLYIKGVPVLYTPYFGFSTDKTRRSGILPPTIGYSKDESLLYAQPLFYAPTVDFDLEYVPQVRLKRGYGHEMTMRYADSIYSLFQLNAGSFYEKQNYFEENKLTNKVHRGWNLSYDRSKLFSKKNHQDGLKIDFSDMNDVDYQTTKYDDDIGDYSDKTLTSSLKYFYNTNNYYGDLELKKFKDLTKESNADTIQQLPKLNLHKYTNSILSNNVTYSIDSNYYNYTRSDGVGAQTYDLTIPIMYTNSFFEDYVEFSIGEIVDFVNIDYQNDQSIYEDGDYLTLNHYAKIQTNLLKPYENYLHTINLSATYQKPEVIEENGDLYSVNSSQSELSVFPITEFKENFLVALNSSLYDRDTLQQIFNYKLSQLYTKSGDSESFVKDDLSQSIRVTFGDFGLKNDLRYSHHLDTIVYSATTLDFNYEKAYFNTYYKYSKDKVTLDNQEDLVYTLGYSFDKFYSLSYKEELDLTKDIKRKKEYRFNIDKRCWAMSLKYINSAIATDTIDDSNQRQHIVYIEFNLKKLFKIEQKYKNN